MLLCNYAWAAEEESAPPARANLRWFGHAYFLITSSDGTRIAIDPYNEKVGYLLLTAMPTTATSRPSAAIPK